MEASPRVVPAARVELTAPSLTFDGESAGVRVRVLNTGVTVEEFSVDVTTRPRTDVEVDGARFVLLPGQEHTTECVVRRPSGVAGSPRQLTVQAWVSNTAGGVPASGSVDLMLGLPADPSARTRDTFHLLADHPITGDGDLLDTAFTARRIADLVLDAAVATPFTLGIQGGWGTGKSSLMQLVRSHLTARHVRVVWFNAWTAEGSSALAALIRSVLRELDRNVLRRIIRRTRATSWVKLPLLVLGSWLGSRGLADEVWRQLALAAPQRNEIRTEIQRALGDWAEKDRTLRAGRLLVVFVDDLDRCSPENVAQVLEAIRLYLDAPGLVFVIGYDPDVVADALATARGVHRTYLEKIVQVDHVMPRPDQRQAVELARLCARYCGVEQLLGEAELNLIVARGQRNPRRIKRFLNTFVLAHHLDTGAALHPAEHIKLLLLRLYFPAFFRLMVTEEHDVIRRLIELSRLRGAVLAARDPDAAQLRWLCEEAGVAQAETAAEALTKIEQHLPALIVELSHDRDLFTLVWSLGDDAQRADLLLRLRDPAAIRAIEPAPEPVPTEAKEPCDHADAAGEPFCPRCGAFLEWKGGTTAPGGS